MALYTRIFAVFMVCFVLAACGSGGDEPEGASPDRSIIPVGGTQETGDPGTDPGTDPGNGTSTITVLVNTISDIGDNGASDSIDTYFYNASGKLTKVETDDLLDGDVDGKTWYEYNGPATSEYIDPDNDGNANYIYNTTMNEDGSTALIEYDFTGDGIFVMSYAYFYDAQGRKSEVHYDEGANGLDGTWDARYLYYYDSDGYIDYHTGDYGFNGSIESVTDYTTDDAGNIIQQDGDTNNDGNTDYSYFYTYDADGNMLTYSYDWDGNGSVDSSYTYTYNADGKVATESYDQDGNGTTDIHTVFNYDTIQITQ